MEKNLLKTVYLVIKVNNNETKETKPPYKKKNRTIFMKNIINIWDFYFIFGKNFCF